MYLPPPRRPGCLGIKQMFDRVGPTDRSEERRVGVRPVVHGPAGGRETRAGEGVPEFGSVPGDSAWEFGPVPGNGAWEFGLVPGNGAPEFGPVRWPATPRRPSRPRGGSPGPAAAAAA